MKTIIESCHVRARKGLIKILVHLSGNWKAACYKGKSMNFGIIQSFVQIPVGYLIAYGTLGKLFEFYGFISLSI